MPSLGTVGLVGIPLAFGLQHLYNEVVVPRLNVMGVWKGPVDGVNNERCSFVPELKGCEDAWVDPTTSLAYL